jgi:hypothetical protein
MKARPFLAVVLALTLLALGLGLAGWWTVWRRSPLQLQHHRLEVPLAARFVPRQAPLSLFLFSDAEEPVGYARAVAPPRQRRRAAEAIERLRDGVFATAGLDYRSELASWLAPGIGLAVLDSPAPGDRQEGAGWLLALGSRDDAGARRFLQRFWQTRSLAGTDLQVSSYRGMGLISGRGALLGRRPVPLATALVNDDLVLIASGRGVLEQALDVSQIDELNLAAQPRFLEGLERLGQGAALVVARPAAFESWLGLPLPTATTSRPTLLMAAVRPDGPSVRLEGLVDLPEIPGPETLEAVEADPGPEPDRRRQFQALLDGLSGNPESLALLHNPAAWLASPLLRPLLERPLGSPAEVGPLPALVAQADAGPLLLAEGPGGWSMGTPADQPPPAAIEAALASQGLVAAPLQVRDHLLTVWTRLRATPVRAGRRQEAPAAELLQASLAGWRTESQGQAWWGGSSLALLAEQGAGRQVGRRERQLEALEAADPILQWAMASAPARALLQPWQPWRLLSTLAGGGLDDAVEGLGLALEPEGRSLHLHGRLELGTS